MYIKKRPSQYRSTVSIQTEPRDSPNEGDQSSDHGTLRTLSAVPLKQQSEPTGTEAAAATCTERERAKRNQSARGKRRARHRSRARAEWPSVPEIRARGKPWPTEPRGRRGLLGFWSAAGNWTLGLGRPEASDGSRGGEGRACWPFGKENRTLLKKKQGKKAILLCVFDSDSRILWCSTADH